MLTDLQLLLKQGLHCTGYPVVLVLDLKFLCLVPHYISAPFSTRDHGRTTRFNVSNTLKCDFKRRLLTVGGRSLNHTLPSVWNSLPQELRDIQSFSSFKSSLKTFLFREAYAEGAGQDLMIRFFLFYFKFYVLSTAIFYQPIYFI